MQITIVGASDRRLEDLMRTSGLRPTLASGSDLQALAHPAAVQPDVLIVDARRDGQVPPALAALKRQHPATSVVLVAAEMASALMLEAMRAGVNECVAEPLTAETLAAAVTRVLAHRASPAGGQIFAFVGAKGGVGTTTLAVNVATALARDGSSTLLIDLNPFYGDAAVLFGAEPRFSVVDALANTHRLDLSFFNGLTTQGEGGVTLLASPDQPPASPMDVHRIGLLLDFAARNFRYTVLDLPRSNAAILDALQAVTNTFVVTTQELASVRGASRIALPLCRRYGRDKVDVVVNRFDKNAGLAIADIEEAVHAPMRFTLPSDYRVALDAQNNGRPVVLGRGGKLADSIQSFTRQISGVTELTAAPVKNRVPLRTRLGALRWRTAS